MQPGGAGVRRLRLRGRRLSDASQALTSRRPGGLSLIERYASQRLGARPYFDADTVRGLTGVRGSQIRARAAEAFTIAVRAIAQAP